MGGKERTAIRDFTGCEDLVCEFGAGFEGELFGEDERVVAVEENGGDLAVLVYLCNYSRSLLQFQRLN